MGELKTVYVPLDNLTPHPNNVRVGDVAMIAESIKAHGQYRPIVVQKSTGFILAGNHTWKAMREVGEPKIAVTYVDVDDEEALRILLVDNRANDLASYDDTALLELLESLASTELSLAGTGYQESDLEELLAAIESVTETTEVDEERSSLLDIADLAYGEPTHKPLDNEVWRLSNRHYLVVAEPHTGWTLFAPYLTGDAFLCIYPDLYITASDDAKHRTFVLVQPNLYLAGHLLDKHVGFFGHDSVERVS